MRARSEAGYTLVEMVVVMAILGFIAGGIAVINVSGSRAESRLAASFQGQTNAHLALDKLRGDVHLACSPNAQSATSVTLSLPPCNGTKLVTWCTRAVGSSYSLYRISGSSCSGGFAYADALTGGSIFSYLGPNSPAGSHATARLHIDMTVNPSPKYNGAGYRLVDDLVFRNSTR